jgi:hypothetical protein
LYHFFPASVSGGFASFFFYQKFGRPVIFVSGTAVREKYSFHEVESLMVIQQIEKFHGFHGAQKFVIVLTSTHSWSGPYPESH